MSFVVFQHHGARWPRAVAHFVERELADAYAAYLNRTNPVRWAEVKDLPPRNGKRVTMKRENEVKAEYNRLSELDVVDSETVGAIRALEWVLSLPKSAPVSDDYKD